MQGPTALPTRSSRDHPADPAAAGGGLRREFGDSFAVQPPKGVQVSAIAKCEVGKMAGNVHKHATAPTQVTGNCPPRYALVSSNPKTDAPAKKRENPERYPPVASGWRPSTWSRMPRAAAAGRTGVGVKTRPPGEIFT